MAVALIARRARTTENSATCFETHCLPAQLYRYTCGRRCDQHRNTREIRKKTRCGSLATAHHDPSRACGEVQRDVTARIYPPHLAVLRRIERIASIVNPRPPTINAHDRPEIFLSACLIRDIRNREYQKRRSRVSRCFRGRKEISSRTYARVRLTYETRHRAGRKLLMTRARVSLRRQVLT